MEFNKQYKNRLRKNLEVKYEGNKDEIINHLIDMYLEEARIRYNLESKVKEPIKTESYSFERFKRAVNKYKRIVTGRNENVD